MWGRGHLIFAHKVKHVLYTYFPEKWRLQKGTVLYSGRYGICTHHFPTVAVQWSTEYLREMIKLNNSCKNLNRKTHQGWSCRTLTNKTEADEMQAVPPEQIKFTTCWPLLKHWTRVKYQWCIHTVIMLFGLYYLPKWPGDSTSPYLKYTLEANEVRTLFQWSTFVKKFITSLRHDKNASVMHNKNICVATKVVFYSLNK